MTKFWAYYQSYLVLQNFNVTQIKLSKTYEKGQQNTDLWEILQKILHGICFKNSDLTLSENFGGSRFQIDLIDVVEVEWVIRNLDFDKFSAVRQYFLQSCFYDIWLDPKTILIIFQFCYGLFSFRKWFAYLVSSRHNFSSHRKSKN